VYEGLRRKRRTAKSRAAAESQARPIEDPEQIAGLVAAAACDARAWTQPVILCLLDAGMRFGEVRGLQWPEVAWGNEDEDGRGRPDPDPTQHPIGPHGAQSHQIRHDPGGVRSAGSPSGSSRARCLRTSWRASETQQNGPETAQNEKTALAEGERPLRPHRANRRGEKGKAPRRVVSAAGIEPATGGLRESDED